MGPTRRALTMVALTVAAALSLAVCATDRDTPTPTTTPTATPLATSTTMPSTGTIRSAEEIDFSDVSVIGPLIDHFGGGEIQPARIEYVDLTDDGQTEAFVVVESGGTMGDLGAALVGVEEGRPRVLGYVEAGGRIELRFPEVGGGVVVATEGAWEPGDALCCPSSLQERTYEWQDRAFVLVDEQVVDNPDVE